MFHRIGILLLISATAISLNNCNNGSQSSNENQSRPVANVAPSNTTGQTSATNSMADATIQSQNANVLGNVGNVTRISFAKGATFGSVSVTLPPNGAKRFAVEGTYGQKIKASADSKDTIVKMISGTDRQVESPGGGLVLEITANGDVIFEVRNASAKELNTNVRAEITKGY